MKLRTSSDHSAVLASQFDMAASPSRSAVAQWRRHGATWVLCCGLLAVVAACGEGGVGDPCLPEQIPQDGFRRGEINIESSSVQCRTRVCLVVNLQGDPRTPLGSPECQDASCPTQEEIDERVFCSCRCSKPTGSDINASTCSCPGGFTCVDDVQTVGGDGIRGGYCIPNSLVDEIEQDLQ